MRETGSARNGTAEVNGRSRQWWSQLAQRVFVGVGVLPILMVLMVIVIGALQPLFLSEGNLTNVIRQATYLTIVSVGQMVVLLSAGFDLSVGSIVGLTSVISATLMANAYNGNGDHALPAVALGIGGGLLVGLIFGLGNGIGVSILRVSPFIVTLGSASVGSGLALLLTGGAPVTGLPDTFISSLGVGRLAFIPSPVFVTLLVVAAGYLVLSWTRIGRYVYAIGGNERAARLSGINVGRYLVLVYIISGVLAALAGILLTARVSTGEPNLGGPFALQSITAAVLGGVSLRGGEGTLRGAVLGAFFIALLSNGMNLLSIQSYYQDIVLGLLLIVAVLVDRLRERWRVIA